MAHSSPSKCLIIGCRRLAVHVVVQVLAVTRSHYHNVCNTFPIGARTALENLGEHAEQVWAPQDTSFLIKYPLTSRRPPAALHHLPTCSRSCSLLCRLTCSSACVVPPLQMVERQFSSIGAKQLLKNLPATLSYKWGSAEGKTDSTFQKRPNLSHDSMVRSM